MRPGIPGLRSPVESQRPVRHHPELACRFASSSSLCPPRLCSRRRCVRSSVACDAPPDSQRTTQVAPPGIPGVSQEEDPAMPATPQTAPQVGLAAQQGPQHDVIPQHQSAHFALAIPIWTEVEMPLDLDYDKFRVSLIIRMFVTSLSYPNRRSGVEGVVTRIFTTVCSRRCGCDPSRPS